MTARTSGRTPHFGRAQTKGAQPCFESGPIYPDVDYLDRRIARHEGPRLVRHKDGTTSTDWSELEAVQFVPGETSYMDWLGSLVHSENPAHVRTAREILGATRFNLVKAGKIEIEKFYYNGTIKSVNDLKDLM